MYIYVMHYRKTTTQCQTIQYLEVPHSMSELAATLSIRYYFLYFTSPLWWCQTGVHVK